MGVSDWTFSSNSVSEISFLLIIVSE